jgi:hypothetical protein
MHEPEYALLDKPIVIYADNTGAIALAITYCNVLCSSVILGVLCQSNSTGVVCIDDNRLV